ncbi:hypothetical protein QVD99_007505 [Batrachochytrium dendrobatidis]|nr:hypothetical protein O5D80_008334 [Batrachochytrium dendrobatidis]KAK5665880.1 hypothetical protein QVD99_007505 [Batrachochytrium dendrobatidis]
MKPVKEFTKTVSNDVHASIIKTQHRHSQNNGFLNDQPNPNSHSTLKKHQNYTKPSMDASTNSAPQKQKRFLTAKYLHVGYNQGRDLGYKQKPFKYVKKELCKPKPNPFLKAENKNRIELEKKEAEKEAARLRMEAAAAKLAEHKNLKDKHLLQRQKTKIFLGKKTLKGQPLMVNQIKHLIGKVYKSL